MCSPGTPCRPAAPSCVGSLRRVTGEHLDNSRNSFRRRDFASCTARWSRSARKAHREALLGLRQGAERGRSTWSIPGGSVVRAETVLACALRELREETGLCGELPRVVSQAFNRLEDGCEWQSVFVAVDVPPEMEPELREPEKCAGWGWFEPKSLPKPPFAPVASLLL